MGSISKGKMSDVKLPCIFLLALLSFSIPSFSQNNFKYISSKSSDIVWMGRLGYNYSLPSSSGLKCQSFTFFGSEYSFSGIIVFSDFGVGHVLYPNLELDSGIIDLCGGIKYSPFKGRFQPQIMCSLGAIGINDDREENNFYSSAGIGTYFYFTKTRALDISVSFRNYSGTIGKNILGGNMVCNSWVISVGYVFTPKQ